MQEKSSLGKILFHFFGALPYKLFCVLYFIVTFPRRLRRIRAYKRAPKTVRFLRMSDTRLSFREAVEVIGKMKASKSRSSSIFGLLEELWGEEMSADWKFPTVREVVASCDWLREDIAACPTQMHGAKLRVWAIDEDTQMFIMFDLTKGIPHHANPKNMLDILRGIPPDSTEQCFVYAVSVIPEDVCNT